MNSSSDESSSDESNDEEPFLMNVDVVVRFIAIYSFMIVIFGVISNIFNCYYFLSTDKFNRFSRFVLSGVSVIDALVISNGSLSMFIAYQFGFDFWSLNESTCKLFSIMHYFTLDFSSFLLEMLAVERMVAVVLPLRVKSICSKKVKILVLVVGGLAIFGKALLGLTIHLSTSEPPYCLFLGGLMFSITTILDNTFNWQCSGVLIVTNTAILIKLSRREFGQESRLSRRSLQSVSLMLGLSVINVILKLPAMIFHIVRAFDVLSAYMSLDMIFYINELTYCFLNTNNAINFVFYLANFSDYRQMVLRCISCGKYQKKKSIPNQSGPIQMAENRV